MKLGNNGCNTVPNHSFPGMYRSFCPRFILLMMYSAAFSADYCLFLESFDTCLAPITSLFLMGVSKLVGYTIQIDIFYSSVLKLSKNPLSANLEAQ